MSEIFGLLPDMKMGQPFSLLGKATLEHATMENMATIGGLPLEMRTKILMAMMDRHTLWKAVDTVPGFKEAYSMCGREALGHVYMREVCRRLEECGDEQSMVWMRSEVEGMTSSGSDPREDAGLFAMTAWREFSRKFVSSVATVRCAHKLAEALTSAKLTEGSLEVLRSCWEENKNLTMGKLHALPLLARLVSLYGQLGMSGAAQELLEQALPAKESGTRKWAVEYLKHEYEGWMEAPWMEGAVKEECERVVKEDEEIG